MDFHSPTPSPGFRTLPTAQPLPLSAALLPRPLSEPSRPPLHPLPASPIPDDSSLPRFQICKTHALSPRDTVLRNSAIRSRVRSTQAPKACQTKDTKMKIIALHHFLAV